MQERSLADPISVLKGAGPKRVVALNKLGVNTIEDLLTFYPFRYDDLSTKRLDELADQEKATIKGTVASQPVVARFGRKKSRLNFRLLVDQAVLMVTFFNQPYLASRLEIGLEVGVYGKYDVKRQQITGMKLFSAADPDDFAGIYRASKEIRPNTVKQFVQEAYQEYQGLLVDVVPRPIQQKYRLEPLAQQVHDMHFPATKQAADLARRSAIFEEFFRYQAGLQFMKKKQHHELGTVINYDNSQLKDFIAALPFELTPAQKKVVNEICSDLHHPVQMNRLLQGDVGSGKTVVAAIAIYAAITAGYQCALMAPTEILAEQHADKLSRLFAPWNVNVALLTSSNPSKAAGKRELYQHLAAGDIQLVVGTHALIQADVVFQNLGLVVTDEQHRFGVEQRKLLRLKGKEPDVLAMTATPIPRTLAITTYGEMDVSVIDQLPRDRKPIETKWYSKKQINAAVSFLFEQIKNGAQAFIVSPLIEESEMLEAQNAREVFAKMSALFEPNYHVGLLHGQLKSSEKEQVMQDFKQQKYAVLVATTVVEVGIDIPNATVMLILDAERFGLAQLHQLRGRVGRGSRQSYCLLVSDPKNDYGKARMETMVQTNDGFLIAQKDLELRGPGEVLGSKQAGMPDFKVGDPVENLNILQYAQQEAHNVISAPNFDQDPSNAGLISYLRRSVLDRNGLD
ncbi:ATP-dependent DNA helicase RecG [Ligilactobacillus salitolerans]|uniref:ATP-dependent DNA helicase RecG n=1 Tax=Ligilactobacillus salitolerans TaxID=1808352 RepID=A0A401IRI4_9LACO|nr:ATP-dependent DNA helicase RecG [Ligilactobacillus salitolerans]GBG94131.1 ATP-dependent DNA helicase RecG [Ligilactobacillus salitolerans]